MYGPYILVPVHINRCEKGSFFLSACFVFTPAAKKFLYFYSFISVITYFVGIPAQTEDQLSHSVLGTKQLLNYWPLHPEEVIVELAKP